MIGDDDLVNPFGEGSAFWMPSTLEEYADTYGSQLDESLYAPLLAALSNNGSITLDNDLINLFYCDCNAQVHVDANGDPVDYNGGNLVRGWNNIVDVEFVLNQKGVGQPKGWQAYTPFIGSGRSALDAYQNGEWGYGLFQTAVFVSDFFLVRSIATSAVKVGARGGLNLFKSGSQQVTKPTGWKVGDRFCTYPSGDLQNSTGHRTPVS